MNQIINMIIRQVIRQFVNRGVNAGFKQASRIGKRQQDPVGEIDDYGNPTRPQMSAEERQQGRAARQNGRQAKQSLKAMRRISKF